MLSASLRFVLCHGLLQRSTDAIKGGKKQPLKACLAAEESLNVTHSHQATRERRAENRDATEKGQNDLDKVVRWTKEANE